MTYRAISRDDSKGQMHFSRLARKKQKSMANMIDNYVTVTGQLSDVEKFLKAGGLEGCWVLLA